MLCRGWRHAAPVLILTSPVFREVSAMQTAKSWIRCLLMTICVLKGADAGPIDGLTALIYDRAHVGKKTLSQAESLASEISARTGIEARWEPGPGLDSGALLNDFSATTGKFVLSPCIRRRCWSRSSLTRRAVFHLRHLGTRYR